MSMDTRGPAPAAPRSAPAKPGTPGVPELPPGEPLPEDPWRERLRRWVMAAAVGAAVVVVPGGPTPGRGPGWRPPAYERALRWRDIIRLRLSPWLLSGMFGPPSGGGPFDGGPPAGSPPSRREPPDPTHQP